MSEHRSVSDWGIMILAISLVASAVVLGGAIKDIRRNDTITVTGSAKRPIRSDYAVWRGSVASQRSSMQDAYRDVQKYVIRMTEFFKQQGIADTSFSWGSIENSEIQEWLPQGGTTGRILAYRITQSFEVRSANVDFIAKLSQKSGDLINEGIPVVAQPPQYLYTKLSDLRVEMLTEATQDAKKRSEKIADGAGNRIGVLRNARLGVFQVTPRNSTDVSDWGMYDTGTIDKDITAVVTLTFAIK